MTAMLQLSEDERLRSYTDMLLRNHLIGKTGVKKGTQFSVNSQLIKNAKVNLKTSLKTIEPYVLKTLVLEDLKQHPDSKISEIAARLPEVDLRELRNMVYAMVEEGNLEVKGANKNRCYYLREEVAKKK